MRIEQLRYLVEVAECGSMSKAAKNLFITQPAISSAISSLEQEIGWPVLERTVSGVQPTTKGKLVVDDAKLIIGLVHNWSNVIDPINLDTITGDVYIADSGELGLSYFQDVIMKLNRQYPKLVIHSVPLKGHPFQELNNGRFQLTVLPIDPKQHSAIVRYLAHYRWYLDVLSQENCKLLISPDSSLAGLESIFRGHLQEMELLAHPSFPYQKLVESSIAKSHIRTVPYLQMVTSVAHNESPAIFPPSQDVLLREFIDNGLILVREVQDLPLPMEIGMIYSDYFSRMDAGKLILQTIKAAVQKQRDSTI